MTLLQVFAGIPDVGILDVGILDFEWRWGRTNPCDGFIISTISALLSRQFFCATCSVFLICRDHELSGRVRSAVRARTRRLQNPRLQNREIDQGVI
jgi:hypothetical protein